MAAYGQELILDYSKVDPSVFELNYFKKCAGQIVTEVKMKKGPIHTWGTDKDENDMPDEKARGISICQFLYHSSLVIHAIDEEQKLFVNLFSCDKFDDKKATALCIRIKQCHYNAQPMTPITLA